MEYSVTVMSDSTLSDGYTFRTAKSVSADAHLCV